MKFSALCVTLVLVLAVVHGFRLAQPSADRINIIPNFSTGYSSWTYSPYSDEVNVKNVQPSNFRATVEKYKKILRESRGTATTGRRYRNELSSDSEYGRINIIPNFSTGYSSWTYSPYSDKPAPIRRPKLASMSDSEYGRINIVPNFLTGRSSWTYSPYADKPATNFGRSKKYSASSDSEYGRINIIPNFSTGYSSWTYSPYSDHPEVQEPLRAAFKKTQGRRSRKSGRSGRRVKKN